MIEGSYEITKFLPINSGDQSISEYVSYHATHLDKSLEHGIETGVFFHTHILYMTFIYSQLLRISQIKEKEFKYSWILSGQENDFMKTPNSPFSFSLINEKTVFRFFRLLAFDDGTIGMISACIKERNKLAHASGENMQDLEKKIECYISNMEKIVDKSKDFLIEVYDKFVSDNQSLLVDDYEIQSYDIESSFLMPYCISIYELEQIIAIIPKNKIITALKGLL